MNAEELLFFEKHKGALPLYEELSGRIMEELEDVTVKVQKTQITFYNKGLFACVSFAKVKKKSELPEPYLTVTFGLEHRAESPRIAVATEPYPNRWTHHVVIHERTDMDEELIGWIREAAAFTEKKTRKRRGRV